MRIFFPREIWENIYLFDPTFHIIWKYVNREIISLNIRNRCKGKNNFHSLIAFNGRTDIHIAKNLITCRCRICDFSITINSPVGI